LRRDALYLADIVEAADAVAEFVAGLKQEALVGLPGERDRSGDVLKGTANVQDRARSLR
jgi:hypothetical protein